MERATWGNFLKKYYNDRRDAFEALALLLFRTKYGIEGALPYFKNNAGNEAEPITRGAEIIGFQAKYFDDEIESDQILRSLDKVHKWYPRQNKLIIYTNKEFGQPRKGSEPAGKKTITDKAKEYGIEVEWILGKDITSLVQEERHELAYKIFFDPNSNLCLLQKHVDEYNQLKLKSISNQIVLDNVRIKLDRSKYVEEIRNSVGNKQSVIIYGESGSGKSAVVKSYCEKISNGKERQYYAFLIIDASCFDADNVNDILNLTKHYDLDDFCVYFNGVANKFVVIDSAEKLLEIEKAESAKLFIGTLNKEGWSFIFTCRTNAKEELSKKIKKDFGIYNCEECAIEPETESSLNGLAAKNGIKLPQNQNLLEQLKYPFFLARYCELQIAQNLTATEFREEIWNQKVRGDGPMAKQQGREQCFLDIVRQTQQLKEYIIPYSNVADVNSACALVGADILSDYPHKGYFIKHDIYADWAWDYIVYADFDGKSDFDKIITKENFAIQYINAFKRWLLNGINEEHRAAIILCESVFNKDVAPIWRKSIFECIGSSKNYAKQWFDDNRTSLSADSYKLFNEFVDVLCVSCYSIGTHIEHRGKEYVLRRATGSGWDVAVDFMWKQRDNYLKNNWDKVRTILTNYSFYGRTVGETKRHAGLLALCIFEESAELRKGGVYSICSPNVDEWAQLVCNYACAIVDKLKSVFKAVIENKWITHTAPYFELISYILTANSFLLNHIDFYYTFKREIIDLMNLFWEEQPSAGNGGLYDYDRRQYEYNSYLFGLNDNFANEMKYYPSSAFQTPIYEMLVGEWLWKDKGFEVIDFVIDFVNNRIEPYKRRCASQDNVFEIDVELRDGKRHSVCVSRDLWELYRGLLCKSSLMESMHMALERHLLEIAKDDKDKDSVSEMLWRILEKSHSCSLYSVVASVATAHPNVYREPLLFVMQNVHFLIYDIERVLGEYDSDRTEIMAPRHKCFQKERHESNNLAHRGECLGDLLIRLQLTAVENGDNPGLERIHTLIDKLKSQEGEGGENFMAQERSLAVNFVEECCLVKVDGDTYDSQRVGSLLKRMEQRQQLKKSVNLTENISLSQWVKYRYAGDFDKTRNCKYDKDTQLVLSSIRTVRQLIESGDNINGLLWGGAGLVFSASALLLLQYEDKLSEAEKEECRGNVFNGLLSLESAISSLFSGFEICIATIPYLIKSMPEEADAIQETLVVYATCKEQIINYRPCDKIYKIVGESKLWETNKDFMATTIEKFKHHIGLKDFALMSPEQAESLLCLLSSNNPMRDLGELCVKKIFELWELDETHKYDCLNISSYTEWLIADYILHAPKEELVRFVSFLKKHVNSISQTFLNGFSILCAENDLYDNFWLAWEELYDCIIKEAYRLSTPVINSYLLNLTYMGTNDIGDWFNIKRENVDFYIRLAKDAGGRPAVIFSIVKVFNTIGRDFLIEIIPAIDDLSKHLTALEQNTKKSILTQLEEMMPRLFNEYNDQRKKDAKLNKHVGNILTSMRDNGSKIAADLLSRM